MNVLVIGSGGREHALAWKLVQSKKLNKLFVAPGNAGTSDIAQNVNISATDFDGIKKLVLDENIEMVVVGPEDPLVQGIHDFFIADPELKNVAVIGPKKDGAILEGSKEFAKEFMIRHNIPTAKYKSVTVKNIEEGYDFLDTLESPYVLKADGLAAGKGVLILPSLDDAKAELASMLDGKFGEASKTVVIEECLKGIELSVFVLTDGENYVILPEAKDYKRIGEGDTGLNTGGMGAITPVPFVDDALREKIESQIVKPTIDGFKKDGIDYKGFVFIGLMNDNGDPKVIEYNVRMGDPETEVVIPRVKSDLLDLFIAVAEKKLSEMTLEVKNLVCTTVMLVSGGYPEKYENGKVISGLPKTDGSLIFHAGTTKDDDLVKTNGGRVIAVSSFGLDIQEALERSFYNANIIDFEGKYYRKDIGFDLKEY